MATPELRPAELRRLSPELAEEAAKRSIRLTSDEADWALSMQRSGSRANEILSTVLKRRGSSGASQLGAIIDQFTTALVAASGSPSPTAKAYADAATGLSGRLDRLEQSLRSRQSLVATSVEFVGGDGVASKLSLKRVEGRWSLFIEPSGESPLLLTRATVAQKTFAAKALPELVRRLDEAQASILREIHEATRVLDDLLKQEGA